jgi:hypothetical protein
MSKSGVRGKKRKKSRRRCNISTLATRAFLLHHSDPRRISWQVRHQLTGYHESTTALFLKKQEQRPAIACRTSCFEEPADTFQVSKNVWRRRTGIPISLSLLDFGIVGCSTRKTSFSCSGVWNNRSGQIMKTQQWSFG